MITVVSSKRVQSWLKFCISKTSPQQALLDRQRERPAGLPSRFATGKVVSQRSQWSLADTSRTMEVWLYCSTLTTPAQLVVDLVDGRE